MLGEFLIKEPKNAGARGIGKSGVAPVNPTPESLSLSKKERSETVFGEFLMNGSSPAGRTKNSCPDQLISKPETLVGDRRSKSTYEKPLNSEALLGEFLKDAPKHPPGSEKRIGRTDLPISEIPTLKSLELSKDESAEAQMLAAIKEEDPEKFEEIRK